MQGASYLGEGLSCCLALTWSMYDPEPCGECYVYCCHDCLQIACVVSRSEITCAHALSKVAACERVSEDWRWMLETELAGGILSTLAILSFSLVLTTMSFQLARQSLLLWYTLKLIGFGRAQLTFCAKY